MNEATTATEEQQPPQRSTNHKTEPDAKPQSTNTAPTSATWCPGYNRDPHPAEDLTADHITEIAYGGDPHGPLQVLCRSCNGRKARCVPPAATPRIPET